MKVIGDVNVLEMISGSGPGGSGGGACGSGCSSGASSGSSGGYGGDAATAGADMSGIGAPGFAEAVSNPARFAGKLLGGWLAGQAGYGQGTSGRAHGGGH